MPRGGARGQNLGHLRIFKFFFFFFLLWNHSYLNNRYYLGLTISMGSDLRVQCPQSCNRGQNLEHLIIIFCFSFSFMDSFVFRQHVLFRVDFLSVTLDHRVQCPRVGLGVKI